MKLVDMCWSFDSCYCILYTRLPMNPRASYVHVCVCYTFPVYLGSMPFLQRLFKNPRTVRTTLNSNYLENTRYWLYSQESQSVSQSINESIAALWQEPFFYMCPQAARSNSLLSIRSRGWLTDWPGCGLSQLSNSFWYFGVGSSGSWGPRSQGFPNLSHEWICSTMFR